MSEKGSQKVSYKYYLLGDTVPVRVSFNERGDKFAAEVPDTSKGSLIQDVRYLGRIEESFEVEDITELQFQELAEAILGHGL